ncbi:hypothetical protein JRG66_06230 [Salinimicrobium tongyeongense]|jgi:hypothetical protein|uniref:NlpE N-terminal domain-containing protein n=1 Tax=Salinimicrobium tongyeongense TaxID=2809707 RepID=A0ABY6NU93_9FLAO|nr:hypothetical protein [Salinimicrobium tongyeongense]UZH56455.1 hypothetical protein JRG66_06230 [Salinimicrobium tongyeongense]
MKKIYFALLAAGLFTLNGCGEDSDPTEVEPQAVVAKDSIPTIKGDFIFLADAAVIKGKDFIYGVQIDSLSRRLADSVAEFKEDDFDMVPVTVKARILQNPRREGWEELVEIKEIIEISTPQPDTSAAPRIKKDIQKP